MQMSNHCSQIMMLRSKLKTKLDPMRYEHSLSVSFTCMNLAMRYGYDIDKAELAGLMHDCGKRFADEIILKSGIMVATCGIIIARSRIENTLSLPLSWYNSKPNPAKEQIKSATTVCTIA